MNHWSFEEKARIISKRKFGQEFKKAKVFVGEEKKEFDLVSEEYVGDAKYYSMTKGGNTPYAKLSVISEYVWLLENLKDKSKKTFLVFGNDKRVPEYWLKRFKKLTRVKFYFLEDEGDDLIQIR